ncbi:hypothetical protein ACG7TL_008673 [Trametes sanguinea]
MPHTRPAESRKHLPAALDAQQNFIDADDSDLKGTAHTNQYIIRSLSPETMLAACYKKLAQSEDLDSDDT